MEKKISISCSAGGAYGFYLLGILDVLSKSKTIQINTFRGSSCAAIIGIMWIIYHHHLKSKMTFHEYVQSILPTFGLQFLGIPKTIVETTNELYGIDLYNNEIKNIPITKNTLQIVSTKVSNTCCILPHFQRKIFRPTTLYEAIQYTYCSNRIIGLGSHITKLMNEFYDAVAFDFDTDVDAINPHNISDMYDGCYVQQKVLDEILDMDFIENDAIVYIDLNRVRTNNRMMSIYGSLNIGTIDTKTEYLQNLYLLGKKDGSVLIDNIHNQQQFAKDTITIHYV